MRSRLATTLIALWFAASAVAQTLGKAADRPIYEPEYGQPGKDVVWVPTPDIVVDTMIDLAKITADDYVIDLGSGDGRLVIAAAKRGAQAVGIEYDDNLVAYAQRSARQQGVAERAQFLKADIFATDFSQATVLTLFLLPEMNVRLRPQILAMRPGTRVVANYFGIGDWSADEAVHLTEKDKCGNYCIAYLWYVPAKVDGKWDTPQGELTLIQGYQYVKGWLETAGGTRYISQGRVRGDTLNFMLDGVSYSGRVSGDAMDGAVRHEGGGAAWKATRKAPPAVHRLE